MNALSHPTGSDDWIGVDFDRTLARYDSWEENGTALGAPLAPMVERVKRWIAGGMEVRIFTARAASSSRDREEHIRLIKEWCQVHIGRELEVTAEKDFSMVELWDDRAVRVDANDGCACSPASFDPLTMAEEIRLWQRDKKKGDE